MNIPYYSGLEILNNKVILRAEMTNHNKELRVATTEGDITFAAYGDCCSESWFEHWENADNLVNGNVELVEEISMSDIDTDNNYERIQAYGFIIHLSNRTPFKLEMRNSSNGYYGGSIRAKECYDGVGPQMLDNSDDR